MRPTRRDFLQLAGAGGFAALSCGDNAPPPPVAVAVLEPSSDALLVAVWARAARTATVLVRGSDGDVEQLVQIGDSGSGAVDVTGLAAGTVYEVFVTAGGVPVGPFVATTAPRDDDPRPVRIAIVADVDPNPDHDSDLVDHVVQAEPDLLIGLGDWPYCDNGPILALTPDEYRDRHVEARVVPKFRALHQAAGLRAIYDDHEFRNNWDAERAASEASRYAAATTVWDEFFPIRDPTGEVRYRNWRWGANLECFLLDCRRFRSANADADDVRKTMLGATQLQWLRDAIAASTATFKLVATTVPLDFADGDDAWPSFSVERDALLDSLVGTRGLVFVTADQHWFASHRHAFGIREFQFGPLARGIGKPPDVMPPGVLAQVAEFNVGLLDFDGETLTVTALGPGGERLHVETVTADELTPRR